MSHYIDTHAHIYSADFKDELPDVMARCLNEKVEKIFMPNVDHTSIDQMMEVEHRWPSQCFAMMGLHPVSVKKNFERELYIVESWLAKRSFAAVGEIGTDLYWDKSFWGQQQEALNIQLGWAKKYNLPVVLHCRESIDETIEIISQHQDGTLTGVFHCFTGSKEQADAIVMLGFKLGIGGVATFKKGGLDIVLPDVDLKDIVLETDSPGANAMNHRTYR